MMYMGGKARIARHLIGALRERVPAQAVWWEPFMGGANMTEALAEVWHGGTASDYNADVAGLWAATVHDGWEPPILGEEEYRAAGELPVGAPERGLLFGCSFGGGTGYARSHPDGKAPLCVWGLVARRGVIRTAGVLRAAGWTVLRGATDFFSVAPTPGRYLYCDPPYANTTGYSTGAFDHAAFWRRCREWRAAGSRVFVSEYHCPVPHTVVWSGQRSQGFRTKVGVIRPTELLAEVLR